VPAAAERGFIDTTKQEDLENMYLVTTPFQNQNQSALVVAEKL
jgi:hypothetical protein